MPKKIQFGWAVASGMRDKARRDEYMPTIRRGLELIDGHFDSLWFIDHLQFGDADLMEGWTMLNWLAAQNPQFHFGHAVLCQSFRNPALLAKMAATAQFLSEGRFILGIGAGWKEDEYKSYGYEYPPAGQRVTELEETLQIVKALWRDEKASFQGRYYSISEAMCEPKPDPLPTIMIGGAKPRMLRLVARHADWWNVSWTGIDRYRDEVVECEKACAEVGREVASLRRSWFGGCACGPTEQAVADLQGQSWPQPPAFGFHGTPDQVIAQMREFIDLGVDYFMVSSAGFPDLTTLELLVKEVLPALNDDRD